MHYTHQIQNNKRNFNIPVQYIPSNKRLRTSHQPTANRYPQTPNGFPVLKRGHFLTLLGNGNMQAPKSKKTRQDKTQRSREDKVLRPNARLFKEEIALPVDRLLQKAGDICFSPNNGRGDRTAVVTNVPAYEELYALMQTFKKEAMVDNNQEASNETKQKNGVDRFQRLKDYVEKHEALPQQIPQQQNMMAYSHFPMNMESVNFNFTENTHQSANLEPFVFGQDYMPKTETMHQDIFTPVPTTKAYTFPEVPFPELTATMTMPLPLTPSYTIPQALTGHNFGTTENYHFPDPLNDPLKGFSSGLSSSYTFQGTPPLTQPDTLNNQEATIHTKIALLYQELNMLKQQKQNPTPPPEPINQQFQNPVLSQIFQMNRF